MKNVYKQIATAYMLERISPATYEQVVDIIKENKRVQAYTAQELLRSFDIPFIANTSASMKQFKKVKDVIAARIKLDKEIMLAVEDIPLRYTLYEH